MPTFDQPNKIYHRQNEFSESEVGLTHPDTAAFFKLCDNGDIELVAGNGVSILMSPRSRSITLNADTIKFMTKHEGGLRWNRLIFNEQASSFQEPTFLDFDDEYVNDLYRGVEYFE